MGQAAAGGALVQVGGDSGEQRCVLSFGDVVALSGDYLSPDDLFRLAAIPGDRGTQRGTRDEVIGALKVMAVDEGVVDNRFASKGEFGDFQATASAGATEVERRVRNRYLTLAAANGDHFVAPCASSSAAHPRIASAELAERMTGQSAERSLMRSLKLDVPVILSGGRGRCARPAASGWASRQPSAPLTGPALVPRARTVGARHPPALFAGYPWCAGNPD